MSAPGRPPISRRRALRITAVAGVSLVLGGGLTRELIRRAGLHRVSRTRTQLGTRVTISVVHPDPEAAGSMIVGAFAEIERLEGLLSRYRPDSPVSRLAREGVLRRPPPELVEILGRARELSDRTGGAFDVTVAPLLDLYRMRSGIPTRAEVGEALALVGYRRLGVEDGLVSFDRAGMSLTLDGIGKGYVVDRAVAHLAARGADRVLVEAGGDLAASGDDLATATDGPTSGHEGGWGVAIQDPHDPQGSLGVLRLRGRGVASSGDYVHAFTGDRRHHHILDPRTGVSPDHTSGVTVVAPSAMEADMLSTAVFVLGPAEGLAFLEDRPGVEGMIVARDGSRATTAGFG